jgi:hypothetical protein
MVSNGADLLGVTLVAELSTATSSIMNEGVRLKNGCGWLQESLESFQEKKL